MKKSLSYIILSIGFFLYFLAIFWLVKSNFIIPFDNLIFSFYKRNKFITTTMKCFTFFAEPKTIIYLSFVLVLLAKSYKDKFFVIVNPIISLNIFHFIKLLVKRPRPFGINLITQGGYSFPSGHSFISISFYGFMIFIINKRIKNNTLKMILTSILTSLIILIVISRIYLGVHYPSDCLAGFTLGLSYLFMLLFLYNRRMPQKVDKKPFK